MIIAQHVSELASIGSNIIMIIIITFIVAIAYYFGHRLLSSNIANTRIGKQPKNKITKIFFG